MKILIENYKSWNLKTILYVNVFIFFSSAYAQIPPNLYSLNNYAVFTSVGAISNTGPTNINGDVGTNVGAFTGFPPGNISGSIHIADSNSARAAVDMDSIYAQINRLNCDTALDSTLGPNQVIYPGIMCISSAAILTGQLTFDGLSKKDSYFIIKINGAFNTANLSEMLLYDSASSKNIFWLINGAVILGDSSKFLGNIIANGAISILNFASIKGKALTRQGAISMINNTIDTTQQMNPLFVLIKDYSITIKDRIVHLNWEYLQENNEKITFNFDRSNDGINWKTISSTNNYLTPETISYHLVDLNPKSSLSYYRLCILEQGIYTCFKVQSIFNEVEHQIIVYPNPNHGNFYLYQNGNEALEYAFQIFSSEGKLVYVSEKNEDEIDLSSIHNGLYFIHITIDGALVIKKILIE